MKILITLLLLVGSIAKADNITINPGATVTIGASTITCVDATIEPQDRCGKYSSTDQKINVCSGRIRGISCKVNGFSGTCDLAGWGSTDMCICQ